MLFFHFVYEIEAVTFGLHNAPESAVSVGSNPNLAKTEMMVWDEHCTARLLIGENWVLVIWKFFNPDYPNKALQGVYNIILCICWVLLLVQKTGKICVDLSEPLTLFLFCFVFQPIRSKTKNNHEPVFQAHVPSASSQWLIVLQGGLRPGRYQDPRENSHLKVKGEFVRTFENYPYKAPESILGKTCEVPNVNSFIDERSWHRPTCSSFQGPLPQVYPTRTRLEQTKAN